MRMSFRSYERRPALNGALCLVLAALLAGCASKNPLMEDAPVAASNPSTPATGETANSGTQRTGPTGFRKFLGIFAPYRVDIQQGNFVSREMVDRLKESMQRPEGLNREQVRFALGTPLLTDVFHANRWDYIFRLQKNTGEVISSRVTVFFDDNRLARIEGGDLPTEQEYLAFIADEASAGRAKK